MLETIDKISPHSLPAEQEVLGAILFSSDCFPEVVEIITPADFYRTAHQLIFGACLELFRLGEPITIVSVREHLNDADLLEQACGVEYLMDLSMNVTTTAAIKYHAEIVKGHSLRRDIINLGIKITQSAYNQPAIEALELAQKGILDIAVSADKQKDESAAALVKKALANIQEKLHHPNRITGLPTGFPNVDQYTGGLKDGKLIILGARPAMGKSGFALNIATNVAIDQKRPVLFYSLEMAPDELMERALISIAETQTHLGKLADAGATIPNTLRIIDRPQLTTTQLRASIIKHRLVMGDVGLVIVDYLQLMKGSGNNRNEEISGISRDLKLIAREFNIPVLALSQLSRKLEERQDKRPMNSDLRDSGAIEQDADQILFIYRDEYYNPESDDRRIAEIIIGKNRGGPQGTVKLAFHSSVVKFIDQDAQREYRNDQ